MTNNYVVIFDLDFTIWDHITFEEQSVDMAKFLGIPYSDEFAKQIIDFWSGDFLKDIIITKDIVAQKVKDHIPYLTEHSGDARKFVDSMTYTDKVWLNKGALSLLKYLREKGYTIVAYTDWFLDYQELLMKELGIRNYFDHIFSWDDTFEKPSKKRIGHLVQHFLDRKFIYIGDSLSRDIKSANYIQECDIIWYSKNKETKGLKVDYVTDNLSTIIPYLEEKMKKQCSN